MSEPTTAELLGEAEEKYIEAESTIDDYREEVSRLTADVARLRGLLNEARIAEPAQPAAGHVLVMRSAVALRDAEIERLRELVTKIEAERDGTYRERARLVAFLAACYPSEIIEQPGKFADEWPVIYVTGPTGQLSWHLSRADLDLFGHVQRFIDVRRVGDEEPRWDGHTTEEKYERLARLIPHAMDDSDLLATIREQLTSLIAHWRDTAARTAERQGATAAHAAYLRSGSDAIKACADALAELLET